MLDFALNSEQFSDSDDPYILYHEVGLLTTSAKPQIRATLSATEYRRCKFDFSAHIEYNVIL